jgi:hypothetical protein
MSKPSKIVVSSTLSDASLHFEDCRKMAHWIVKADGTMIKANDIPADAAEVKVAYVGGKGKKDSRTPEQKLSLSKVVEELQHHFPDATLTVDPSAGFSTMDAPAPATPVEPPPAPEAPVDE